VQKAAAAKGEHRPHDQPQELQQNCSSSSSSSSGGSWSGSSSGSSCSSGISSSSCSSSSGSSSSSGQGAGEGGEGGGGEGGGGGGGGGGGRGGGVGGTGASVALGAQLLILADPGREKNCCSNTTSLVRCCNILNYRPQTNRQHRQLFEHKKHSTRSISIICTLRDAKREGK